MSSILQELDKDGILTISFNHPEKLNTLNDKVLQKLKEIFTTVKTQVDVKALLLTGIGKAFCAGADISRLALCNAQSGYQFACEGQQVFSLLEELGKPSLVAVNGFAFGGGCELAMAATLRIAAINAQFDNLVNNHSHHAIAVLYR